MCFGRRTLNTDGTEDTEGEEEEFLNASLFEMTG